MVWLLVLLTGCFEPEVTGPTGMVGRVLDAEGKPAAGIRIVSEEHGDTTDKEGRFGVQYKEPSQYVHFFYEGLWMRRQWQGDGDQLRVVVRLPPLQDLEMFCELSYQCAAEFTWELEDHLEAVAKTKCLPGIATGLARVPPGIPTAICRSATGSVSVPRIELEGRKIRLLPPPSPIRVTVHDRNRTTPSDCKVRVNGVEVESVGGGIWIGEANGMTSVGAVCAGVPAVPQYVKAEEAERVVLQWLGMGPNLTLPKSMDKYKQLYIQSDTANGGWRVRIDGAGQVFRVPPLPVGDYRLSLGDPSILKRMNMGDPAETDVVIWSEQESGYLGSLRVTRNKISGAIKMSGFEDK